MQRMIEATAVDNCPKPLVMRVRSQSPWGIYHSKDNEEVIVSSGTEDDKSGIQS